MKRADIPRNGVIQTRNWIHTPDGDQSNAFYCERWLIVTDKEADLAGIKSADKWAAVAYGMDGQILMIIPGCEVVGYVVAFEEPSSTAIYNVK